MIDETTQQVDEKNRWRLETPGHDGWQRTAHPDDPDRYLMISADCHVNEPSKLWWERIDAKFRNRLPHIEIDDKGVKWTVVEGCQRSRVRPVSKDDAPRGGEDRLRGNAGRDPLDRIRDQMRDGIDAEIVFPNKGLAMFATQDPDSAPSNAACGTIGLGDLRPLQQFHVADGGDYHLRPRLAIAEIERVAKMGFRGLTCRASRLGHPRRAPPQLQSGYFKSDVGD